jgi:hypothetical protein
MPGGTPNTTRRNRIAMMMTPKTNLQPGRVEPSIWNRILASKWLGSNTNPLPSGTFKKVGGARKRLTEYQLRALSELSYRSPNVVQSNLKTLRNKPLAKRLRVSIRKTRNQR